MARDVTDATFQADVVEGSRTGPVVVDFWASWCAPCRSLGPILEKVSDETGVTLAKVDVDANPRVAGAFGVRSIPTVYAFKDGMVVDQFVGALPEQQVRQFFAGLQPSHADTLAAQADTAPVEDKERLYRAALDSDRAHRGAIVGLASLLAARGEDEEARALVSRIPPDAETAKILAGLDLKTSIDVDLDDLRFRVASDPADTDAVVALARAEAAGGDHASALSRLIEIARESDEARQAMVDIFVVLGDDNDLTRAFRPKLAAALF